MVAGMSRDELVRGLVRIGEMMVTGEDQAEIDAYFAPDFTFHGRDGGESRHEGLEDYFAALRAALPASTSPFKNRRSSLRAIEIAERSFRRMNGDAGLRESMIARTADRTTPGDGSYEVWGGAR